MIDLFRKQPSFLLFIHESRFDLREKCLPIFSTTISPRLKKEEEKMKKTLISAVALLAVSMLLVAPAKAKTTGAYSSHIESVLMDPGKQWVSEDGILHIRDSYWVGTEVGTLGSSTLEDWLSLNVDLATGEGNFNGHWQLTFEGRGTFSGSATGRISLGYLIDGIFIGTHATGEFEGVQKKGLLDGYLADPTHMILETAGSVYYP
jgi:hypothetical protein